MQIIGIIIALHFFVDAVLGLLSCHITHYAFGEGSPFGVIVYFITNLVYWEWAFPSQMRELVDILKSKDR